MRSRRHGISRVRSGLDVLLRLRARLIEPCTPECRAASAHPIRRVVPTVQHGRTRRGLFDEAVRLQS